MRNAVRSPKRLELGMKRRVERAPAGGGAAALIAMAIAVCASGAASAQAPSLPEPGALPSSLKLDPNFTTPKISSDYLEKLGKLPDWNGRWTMRSGDKRRPAEIMYDPMHFYDPPDPAPAEEDHAALVGPLPGAYVTNIPYKPEYKKKYEKIVADTKIGKSIDRVGACEPYGMPRVMGGAPSGPEIIMTPEVVIMTFDAGSAIRHIYTDGRGHRPVDPLVGPRLSWNGDSIGHWEGDTLVVDTVGVYPGYYDQTDPPHSDQIHITERIYQIHQNWLADQITVEDPVMLTRPYTVTRYYARAGRKYPNYGDDTCPPGESIDMSKGYQTLVLPSEARAAAAKTKSTTRRKK